MVAKIIKRKLVLGTVGQTWSSEPEPPAPNPGSLRKDGILRKTSLCQTSLVLSSGRADGYRHVQVI